MENQMEKIISLCKRRGFIYPGSEIYGGLAGTWDYGPLGVELKRNIQNLWWKMFVLDREDMYGIDAAIIMNPKVWMASGHVGGFNDPMIDCKKCKKRFRADHLRDQFLEQNPSFLHEALKSDLQSLVRDFGSFDITCPNCGNLLRNETPRQFNMMFKTSVGATEDEEGAVYLRPETAQGMFVNFKNIMDSIHPKLPFGLAQIGKAFRNEIAPRDFTFRAREFEQMEIEYFVDPRDEKRIGIIFDELYENQITFLKAVGLPAEKIHKIEVPEGDRAHYSKRSVDTEFDFPFGQKELLGLAYRTDYDLQAHNKASGADLSIFDEETKDRFVPYCIEPTFGVDRLLLAVLSSAYKEEGEGEDMRVVLSLPKNIAPYVACVSPLLKNKPELVAKAREVFLMLKKKFGNVVWDDNGNIGKRYRRQDEIGTPYCIVIDFDTLGENKELIDTVTIRDRDSGTQERVAIGDLSSYIQK